MIRTSIYNVLEYSNCVNSIVTNTKARKLRVTVKKTTDDFTAIQYKLNIEPNATYKFQIVGRYRANSTTRSKGIILWINGKYISNIVIKHDANTNYLYEYTNDSSTRNLIISFVFMKPTKGDIMYLLDFNVNKTIKQNLYRLKEIEDIVDDIPSRIPDENTVNRIVNQYMEKYKMEKELTVVVSATQQPYQGGASTCAYNFIKMLRHYNIRCAGLFFIYNNDEINTRVNIDPEEIGGVFQFDTSIKSKLHDYLETPSPRIIFAFDFLAPKLSIDLFNYTTLVYMVTSSFHCNILSGEAISYIKYLENPSKYCFEEVDTPTEIISEKDSIKTSDHIITNSQLAKTVLKTFHIELESFITDEPINSTVLSINQILLNHDIKTNKPFKMRKYDMLYVVTDTLKQIKNPKFAKDLLKSAHLRKVTKVVIGNNITYFSNTNNLKQLPIVSQSELFEYMKESKTIIIPSFYDSSPPLMYEAILCGCIPIVSQNVGNYNILDKQMICNDVYDMTDWLTHINHVLKHGEKIQDILPNIHELYLTELNKLNDIFELNIHIM